jgi:hypothetical protein
MCQDIGHISGNVDSGGERNLFIAIATNGYFPTLDVEIKGPLEVSSAGWNGQKRAISRDVRLPSEIGPRASVEGGVWHTQSFQLALNICFRPGYPLCPSLRYSSIL